MISTGLLGAVALAPLWAAIAVLVFVRHRGRSLADWAPIVTRYALRRRTGQTLWLARPVTRPRQDGVLHLPGTAASLQVVTPGDSANGAAAVHDPHQQTLTAVVRVSSRAFALLDPATQNHNVSGWGRALAGIARTGHIATVQVLERTVPDCGDTLARHWTEHGQPQTPVAGQIYSELVAARRPRRRPARGVRRDLPRPQGRPAPDQPGRRRADRGLHRHGADHLHLRPGRPQRRTPRSPAG